MARYGMPLYLILALTGCINEEKGSVEMCMAGTFNSKLKFDCTKACDHVMARDLF